MIEVGEYENVGFIFKLYNFHLLMVRKYWSFWYSEVWRMSKNNSRIFYIEIFIFKWHILIRKYIPI